MKKCNMLICSHYGHNASDCDTCKFRNIDENEKNRDDQRIYYVQKASDSSARKKDTVRCKKRR